MKLSDAIEAGFPLATPTAFNLFAQFEPNGPIEACTMGMGVLGAGIVTREQVELIAATEWNQVIGEEFGDSMEKHFPGCTETRRALNLAAEARFQYGGFMSEESADTLSVLGLIAVLNDEVGVPPLDIAALLREFGF
jgi:hypothetical protein